MGQIDGFIKKCRTMRPERPVNRRLRDFREIYEESAPDFARDQAARCMDCGVPFCQQGCPLGNHIPDWNDLVYQNRLHDAYLRLSATNNFPEFTGRLCPAPCEGACVLAIDGEAVAIEDIERDIIDRAFTEGWVNPRPPVVRTGHRVAIVGSGPAGLAAAAQLNSIGHQITVYERAPKVGGLLRYGIPDFKLEKNLVERRAQILGQEGIRFIKNTEVGREISWSDVRDRHDALLITIGSGKPRDLEIPGRKLGNIHFAMDFLVGQNRVLGGECDEETMINVAGKHVIILGGGDTGSDCLGSALRQNAQSVRQIELLNAPPEQRSSTNPWPQWPLIFRTSSSQKEGGTRDFGMVTTRLSGANGNIQTLHARAVDSTMRTSEQSAKEFEFPVDVLILALGFLGPKVETAVAELGIETDRRGNILSDENFQSTAKGVFAAGDSRRGASLIVWAIAEGREASRAIDAYLRKGPPWLPTRGIDTPYGGR